MKILLVSPYLPYSLVPHAGGQQINTILKYISKKHDIHLIARVEPEQIKYIDELTPFCKSLKLHHFKTPSAGNPFRIPLIILSYLLLSFKANNIIKNNNFDIVQVEYVETGLGIRRQSGAVFILDAHDVITKPAMRRYKQSRNILHKTLNHLRWKLTVWIEGITIKKFDSVFTRSPLDRDILLSAYNYQGRIDVFPHPLSPIKLTDKNISRDTATILFVGLMEKDFNITSVLFIYNEVLPLIRNKINDLKFYIIGKNPPDEIKDLSVKDTRVVVTGFVSDLSPYYQRATIAVTPLFIGGGIIVKNIEAMAHGVPVITTPVGNEGIGAVPGRDLLVAETPEEFAKAIKELFENPDKMKAIGENGREFVEKYFNIDAVFDKIDKIYNELHEKI